MRLLPALLLACSLPIAAQAQTPAQDPAHVVTPDPVVLRVESGSVMVSQQGAEFVTVEADATLQAEDRVLLPEGSVASLDYGDGCVVSLVTGTHPIATSCPVAASSVAGTGAAPGVPVASAAGPSTAVIVGGVAGVAAIAAIAGGGSSSKPAPVSR